MLFKGHSTRLEMLIEKIHSHKENSYQDSDISGSTSSEIRTGTENRRETNLDSPKSQGYSDTEEEKDWDEIKTIDNTEISKESFEKDNSTDEYTCTFCPRHFKHKRSRDRHIKLHTGDKKYKCLQCESAFARSDHLKIHLKTHDVRKHYKCSICQKGYNTVSALCYHGKSHQKYDGNVENKSSSSLEFENSISSAQNLENIHSTSQNYLEIWSQDNGEKTDLKTICVYCFQWFSSIETMIEHVQICHRSLANDFDEQKLYYDRDTVTGKRSRETCDSNSQKSETNVSKKSKPEQTPLQRNQYEETSPRSQDTFICACCYQRFPNFKSFSIHMETHVSHAKKCPMCGEDLYDMLSTNATNVPMVPLTNSQCCCHCDRLFGDSDTLQSHLFDHHVVTSYKCSICEEIFKDISSIKVHLHNKHISNREHFQCDCSEDATVFHDRMSAELHFSKFHSAPNSSEHKCQISESKKEFPESISKNPCFSSGSSGHRCVYCKEYFKSKSDLQLHLRSHQISDKSRHKCNICDDTFTSSAELASHKLIHCKIIEGNSCVQCKAIILDEEGFIKHQLKHNDNSKSTTKVNLILPSICIVCGQTLQSDREIELHAKFHLKFLSDQARNSRVSEESVFPSEQSGKFRAKMDVSLELHCHLCKKSFTAKDKLQIHLIEHNFFGINQFSCYICSSVFTGAAGLQGHLLEHNLTEKPYQCSQCSAGFFFRTELDNHRYSHNFNLQFDYLSDEYQTILG